MHDTDRMADRFEEHRARLRAIAYRMLGSLSDADDAVQEAWLRLSRTNDRDIENLGGWLTTVVTRVCLNLLRARRLRHEAVLGVHVPDPIVSPAAGSHPEQHAIVSDAIGLALMVVLDTLTPTERVAFVLHDLFDVPFAEIAPLVERSPNAARQLASRARRRVQGQAPVPDADLTRQRAVVDAFFAAARGGDLAALIALLDPDVLLRADFGTGPAGRSREIRGAPAVADQALLFAHVGRAVRPVRVNGAVGALVVDGRGPHALLGFTVTGGTIRAIDVIADPTRLQRLGLPDLPARD